MKTFGQLLLHTLPRISSSWQRASSKMQWRHDPGTNRNRSHPATHTPNEPQSPCPQLERAVRRRADQELPPAVPRHRLDRVLVARQLTERLAARGVVAAHAAVVAGDGQGLFVRVAMWVSI
jgi:hypothetical protein